MDVVKLPVGVSAPPDTDCISIDRLSDGRINLTGSLLKGEESIAILETRTYERVEEAEQVGIAWAAENGVETLYVAFDTAS